MIGAFLDRIKTDTLLRRQSHGIWVLDGFQAELCPPSSHPLDLPPTLWWVTALSLLPFQERLKALFSFILLCTGHVRLRVLIDHRLGLLNLVVGQGDKWKVWPVPSCHYSLLFWLSRASWWQLNQTGRGHSVWSPPMDRAFTDVLNSCLSWWLLGQLLTYNLESQVLILTNQPQAFSRRLLPVRWRWRHLCLHVWEIHKPGWKRFWVLFSFFNLK